jgi:hypothetical protein
VSLPVRLFYQLHVHGAHFHGQLGLVGRVNGLRLLRNHSASIFGAVGDILVHALVLLIQQTLFVILRVIVLQEKLELFFFDLLGKVLRVLLVSRS